MSISILLVGIGQSLRGDDAAGLEAVRLWQASYHENTPDVQVEFCELPGLDLLNLLTGTTTAILVDAVVSGAVPGTIHRLDRLQLAAFLPGSNSAHGWGVAETLALGSQLDPQSLPEKIILIGIEASQMELGAGLSRGVKNALGDVAQAIQEEIHQVNPPFSLR
jgi:hydrogenase maturation protease